MNELDGQLDVIVTGIYHDWFTNNGVRQAIIFYSFTLEDLIDCAENQLGYDVDEDDIEKLKSFCPVKGDTILNYKGKK
jgi:hypothetical protein